MFGSWGELPGEGAGWWEAVFRSCMDTQLLCGCSALWMLILRASAWHWWQMTGVASSLAPKPQSVFFWDFPLSHWGNGGQDQSRGLPVIVSSPSDLEMADQNEGILTFIRILTAVADLFFRPHYLLISNFFLNIVFYITVNKLDAIFTVAWIYNVDVWMKTYFLARKKRGSREIRCPRNNLASESW